MFIGGKGSFLVQIINDEPFESINMTYQARCLKYFPILTRLYIVCFTSFKVRRLSMVRVDVAEWPPSYSNCSAAVYMVPISLDQIQRFRRTTK